MVKYFIKKKGLFHEPMAWADTRAEAEEKLKRYENDEDYGVGFCEIVEEDYTTEIERFRADVGSYSHAKILKYRTRPTDEFKYYWLLGWNGEEWTECVEIKPHFKDSESYFIYDENSEDCRIRPVEIENDDGDFELIDVEFPY